MITVSIVGTCEGFEESKSKTGQFWAYIRPDAVPPQGLLENMRIPREFGAPLDGAQVLGMYAILCNEAELPAVAIGERVTCAASLWPISRPVWSQRENTITHTREISPLFTLDKEIKATNAKPQPATASIEGSFAGAKRCSNLSTDLIISLDAVPPAGILQTRRVQAGKGRYKDGQERIGSVTVNVSQDKMSALAPHAPVSVKAELWPVCDPYFDKSTGTVQHRVMPRPVFRATSVSMQQQSKAAS